MTFCAITVRTAFVMSISYPVKRETLNGRLMQWNAAGMGFGIVVQHGVTADLTIQSSKPSRRPTIRVS